MRATGYMDSANHGFLDASKYTIIQAEVPAEEVDDVEATRRERRQRRRRAAAVAARRERRSGARRRGAGRRGGGGCALAFLKLRHPALAHDARARPLHAHVVPASLRLPGPIFATADAPPGRCRCLRPRPRPHDVALSFSHVAAAADADALPSTPSPPPSLPPPRRRPPLSPRAHRPA
uniref:Uncharacterized protein n=1 Tax=Oryza nivara TaxID=4536 RepID=A0A0E0GVM0_ORYNI